MAPRPDPATGPRRGPSRRVRALVGILEFAVLALLLVIDFELGSRLVGPAPDLEVILGALATACLGVVLAVLVLARSLLPLRVLVPLVLGLSLLASLLALATDGLTLSLTETAALSVVLAHGVRHAPTGRAAALIAGTALLVEVAAVLMRVGPAPTLALSALLVWGCALAAGLGGRYAVQRREAARIDSQRTERLELARELHDVVAHQVSGIVVQAQAAVMVAGSDPVRAREAFASIEAAGTEALSGMRRMVGAIRDEDAGEEAGAPLALPYALSDIPALVDRFDPGRRRTSLRLEEPGTPLPAGVGESAYRVVREALTNVRRHAPGAVTRIRVEVLGTDLVLEVTNDAARRGPLNLGDSGFGLLGMAERVAALGGELEAGETEPGSWRVRATFPLGAAR